MIHSAGVVGLESGYYFSELAGSFQMCATWRSPTSTRCPYEHSFSVPLSITDNSAGKESLTKCVLQYVTTRFSPLSRYWISVRSLVIAF